MHLSSYHFQELFLLVGRCYAEALFKDLGGHHC